MHCMACISACPVKAINYGNKTQNRNRYYLAE
jgi:ferredoxin